MESETDYTAVNTGFSSTPTSTSNSTMTTVSSSTVTQSTLRSSITSDVTSSWLINLQRLMNYGQESSPRGMKIKEILGDKIKVSMKYPIIVLKERKMNYKFMLGEAWWICSGSNKLKEITPYMKRYADYSDDGTFLNGAYGPKIVDQLRYVVDTLQADLDSRQAVINIWRENPRPSKDIPCTLNFQFFIRNDTLHAVVNMRSQDMVWGFSYDVFTFSMVAKVVQTLLAARNINVEMGDLTINQGSAHIYEKHWEEVNQWIKDNIYVAGTASAEVYLGFKSKEPVEEFIWNDPKFSSLESFLNHLKHRADDL